MLRRFAALWLPLALSLAVVPGCSSDEPPAEEPADVIAQYTVRGQVVVFEDDPALGSTVRIHHEPIPSFMSQGKVVGMKAMTMSFPMGEALDVTEIEPDAIVEFTFEVRYDADTGLTSSYQVIEVLRLPDDTELIFNGPEPAPEAPTPTDELQDADSG